MYFTIDQIDSAITSLGEMSPQLCTVFELPEPSVEGRTIQAWRIAAGTAENRSSVLIVGGTHARELLNPDAIIEFGYDLVASYSSGTDLSYGGRTWPAASIKIALEALNVLLVPCLNPDGRNYVMTQDAMWRKNRGPTSDPNCTGTDLNRNCDLLWGVLDAYTSCTPCDDVYCGPNVFSEPESRNVKHLLDSNQVETFVDVHSYLELVMWPWGHAPTETTDPTQVFTTLPTGTCAPIAASGYQEYMDPIDLQRFQTVGGQVVSDIAAVRGEMYTSEPSLDLYATTGTNGDYAYSRHVADASLGKTYGFTLETGPDTGDVLESFQPSEPALSHIKLDARAGMLSLVIQSICEIQLIGTQVLGGDVEVAAIRRMRDALLDTAGGREWIGLYQQVHSRAGVLVVGDGELRAEAAALLARSGQLASDSNERLTDADIDKGSTFLDHVAEAVPSVRPQIEALRAALRGTTGFNWEEMNRVLSQQEAAARA